MRYDVFISYSYVGDDLLSQRVQAGLARFAKPWWRRRALNVFRDQTALAANPGLWSSISEAIDDSRYFLMLASPEAAASPWVAREVEQWRARRGSDGLLVLLTSGEIAWDNSAGDFDWRATTALGSAFAACFAEQPRYVDMRWARSEVQLDLTDGRFRDQIAELAAPVHGIAKDDLAGEDVRQHRRTLRHAWSAGIALALVTLAAVATSAFAVNATAAARHNAARALAEQHAAQTQAGIASSATRAAQLASLHADQQTKNAIAQRKLAVARQHDALLSAADARRQRSIADTGALNLIAANGNLVRVNGQLRGQQHATEQQHLGGLAFQLAVRSQSTADYGAASGTGLLLAVQAASFAARSDGVVGSVEVESALIQALQASDPSDVKGRPIAPSSAVDTAVFSPDGNVLATTGFTGSAQARLLLTYLDDSRNPVSIPLQSSFRSSGPSAPPAVAFGRGTQIAVLNTDQTVDIFDTRDGSRLLHLGSRVSSCSPCTMLGDEKDGILVFSGSLASGHLGEVIHDGSTTGGLTTWDLRSGHATNKQFLPGVFDVQLDASGSRALVWSYSGTDLYDITDRWTRTSSVNLPFSFGSLSPDGRFVVFSENGLTLYDLNRRQVVWSVPGDDVEAWFSTNGTLVTRTCKSNSCGSGPPILRIRSLTTGAVQFALHPGDQSRFFSAALYVSSDRVEIASPSPSGPQPQYSVNNWPLNVPVLNAEACAAAGRNLTAAEWTQYVGPSVPYERTCPNYT